MELTIDNLFVSPGFKGATIATKLQLYIYKHMSHVAEIGSIRLTRGGHYRATVIANGEETELWWNPTTHRWRKQ